MPHQQRHGDITGESLHHSMKKLGDLSSSNLKAPEQVESLAETVAQKFEPAALSDSEIQSPVAQSEKAQMEAGNEAEQWDDHRAPGWVSGLEEQTLPEEGKVAVRSRQQVQRWISTRVASRAACPHVVLTSVKTGAGLYELLMETDRKVRQSPVVGYATVGNSLHGPCIVCNICS